MSIAISSTNTWKSYVLPAIAGGGALTAAILGAFLTGEAGITGGVNGFVESLSGDASSRLGNIGFLGFAFAAGMVATVNPCGFAMLPAYLGLYLGAGEKSGRERSAIRSLGRSLLVSGIVTSGFILLFGLTGILINLGAQPIRDIIPWLGLVIGVILTLAGTWILGGGKLYSGIAGRAAARIGDPGQVSIRGYFLFGLSYGIASLSCALPIFLIVVATTLTASGFQDALAQFVLYAMGMGIVIMALTVSMALFKGVMVGALRKALPYIQPVSAVMMIAAGSYIVYYWLTIGDLQRSF